MNKKEISYFENDSKRQPIGRPKYNNVQKAKRMRFKKQSEHLKRYLHHTETFLSYSFPFWILILKTDDMAFMQATSIVRGHKFTFKYHPKGGTYRP